MQSEYYWANCSVDVRAYLSYEAVELLLGPKPLDLLVYSLVLLQLLQICPATVEIRTVTQETENKLRLKIGHHSLLGVNVSFQ